MSISISETGGGGRDSLLLPLLSRESWMFVKDNLDRKKKKKKSDLSKISKSGNIKNLLMSSWNIFQQKQEEKYWHEFQERGCTWKFYSIV